jgi:hypothetical protein
MSEEIVPTHMMMTSEYSSENVVSVNIRKRNVRWIKTNRGSFVTYSQLDTKTIRDHTERHFNNESLPLPTIIPMSAPIKITRSNPDLILKESFRNNMTPLTIRDSIF